MESVTANANACESVSTPSWSAPLTARYRVDSHVPGVSKAQNVVMERIETSSNARNRTQEHVQLIPNFKQFLAWLIADVKEVRSILMKQAGSALEIYVGIDNFDMDVNERVYDREELIIDVFGNLDFDFHIICLGGRPSIESISDPDLEEVLAR